MIGSINTKPIHPKNGSKYRNKKGEIFIFVFGTWVKQKIK